MGYRQAREWEDSIPGDVVACEVYGDSPAALNSDPMVNREQPLGCTFH